MIIRPVPAVFVSSTHAAFLFQLLQHPGCLAFTLKFFFCLGIFLVRLAGALNSLFFIFAVVAAKKPSGQVWECRGVAGHGTMVVANQIGVPVYSQAFKNDIG